MKEQQEKPSLSNGILHYTTTKATLEFSYLMPKSAFVKANMCYATFEIIHYDNYCLVIKEKTLTPEVCVCGCCDVLSSLSYTHLNSYTYCNDNLNPHQNL